METESKYNYELERWKGVLEIAQREIALLLDEKKSSSHCLGATPDEIPGYLATLIIQVAEMKKLNIRDVYQICYLNRTDGIIGFRPIDAWGKK